MPNNTWFTPYKFPPSACLSLGPSQGIVYALSKNAVVKLPFQYPVDQAASTDEANEQLYMSLRSLALFKKESSFYDFLSEKPHPNLAQRLQSELSGIVLERYKPLQQAWHSSTKAVRLIWIQELLNALEWLESRGCVHGDLKVNNIGINVDNRLRLFDFASFRRRDEEGYSEQVLQDHFALATCIHFLASGIDPVAKAKSLQEVRQTISTLKGGYGVVDEAARDFEDVIQAGWRMVPRPASSFSQIRKTVEKIIWASGVNTEYQPETTCFSHLSIVCDSLVVEKEERWLDECNYRAAWKAKGYETPCGIWD